MTAFAVISCAVSRGSPPETWAPFFAPLLLVINHTGHRTATLTLVTSSATPTVCPAPLPAPLWYLRCRLHFVESTMLAKQYNRTIILPNVRLEVSPSPAHTLAVAPCCRWQPSCPRYNVSHVPASKCSRALATEPTLRGRVSRTVPPLLLVQLCARHREASPVFVRGYQHPLRAQGTGSRWPYVLAALRVCMPQPLTNNCPPPP